MKTVCIQARWFLYELASVRNPLNFSNYVNDVTEGLSSDVKLFLEDTSLFCVVFGIQNSAADINNDLKIIREWANQ